MPDMPAVLGQPAVCVRVADLIQRRNALSEEIRLNPGLFESQCHITPFTADGGGGEIQSTRMPRFHVTPPERATPSHFRAWCEALYDSVTPPAHDDRVDAARYAGFRGHRASMAAVDDPIMDRPYYEQLAAMRGLIREHVRPARVPLRPRSGALESLTLSAEELRGLAAKTPAQLKSWAVDMANRTTRQQPF